MIQIPPKRMVTISMGAAGVVALLAILDLAIGIPFGQAFVMDALFLVSAGIVGYLAWGTLKELN